MKMTDDGKQLLWGWVVQGEGKDDHEVQSQAPRKRSAS